MREGVAISSAFQSNLTGTGAEAKVARRRTWMPPARWKRVLAFVIGGTLELALWGFALIMFVTGLVILQERRLLLAGGQPLQGTVESCSWESMNSRHSITHGSSSGYFSCDYA